MKEARFRLWHKEWKKICYIDGFQILENDMIKFFYDDEYFGASEVYVAMESIHLMQYTGVKDKNGERIYEGDIVKTESGDIQEIMFVQENFEDGVLSAFIALSKKSPYVMAISEKDEVIGNLYENAELLYKTK